MAIAYRAGATARSSVGAPTVTIPATVQVGDAMVMAVTWKLATGTATLTTPVGWKLLSTGVVDGQGASFQGAVYTRTAQTGDAGTSVAVNPGGSSQQVEVVLEAWSGASAILRDFGYAAKGTTAATTASADAETTGTGDWVVLVGMVRSSVSGPIGNPTFTAPAGFNLRHQTAGQSGAAQNVATVIMDGTSTGAKTLTANQASWWICGQIILKETTAAEPPLLVAKYDAGWITSTTPKSVSVTVAAGDWVVVTGISADLAAPLATPTGGGLTYTLQQSVQTASRCAAYIWTAQSASAQTFTLEVTRSGSAFLWGFDVKVFRGVGSIGNGVGASAVSALPEGVVSASATSVIVFGSGDWVPVSGANRVYRAIDGAIPAETAYIFQSSWYTIYTGYYAATDTAGSKTAGLTAPSGQTYSLVAVEVKAPSSGGALTDVATDAVSASDAVALTRGPSPADQAGLIDTVSRTVAAVRTASDAVGIQDVATLGRGATTTDQVGLSDTAAAAAGRSAADAAGLADSATSAVGKGATDLIGITDTAAAVQAATRSPVEQLGIVDSLNVDVARSATDGVGLTDTAAHVAIGGRSASDTATILDNAAATTVGSRSTTDPVGLADTPAITTGRQHGDPLGTTDMVTTAATAARSHTDHIGLLDARTVAVGRQREDALGITDTTSGAIGAIRGTADPVGLADSVTVDLSGAGAATAADPLDISDSATRAVSATRTVSDTTGIVDTALRAATAARAAIDGLHLADSITRSLTIVQGTADGLGINDGPAVSRVVARTDLVNLTDAATVQLIAGGAAVLAEAAIATRPAVTSTVTASSFGEATATRPTVRAEVTHR